MPLARSNGRRSNGIGPDVITKGLEKEAKRIQGDYDPAKLAPGIPVDDVDMIDSPPVRGQRRARKAAIKEDTDDDDDLPLTKKRKTANGTAKAVKAEEEDEDEDDVPLVRKTNGAAKKRAAIKDEEDSDDAPLVAKKLSNEKGRIEKAAAKEAKKIRADEEKAAKPSPRGRRKVKEESDEEEVVATPKAKGKAAAKPKANGVKKEVKEAPKKAAAKKKAVKEEEEDDDDKPLVKTKGKAGAKKVKKEESSEDGKEEESEEYKWWEQQQADGSVKWTTLEHNGVLFPPAYEPLPDNVKLIYDGVPVSMHIEAEEVAGFFGTMLNSTVNVENPKFCSNFFEDFQAVLKRTGGAKGPDGKKVDIKDFKKCNFQKIFDYYEAQREEKRALPAAVKKEMKAEKDKLEEKFYYCQLDGRKEKIGNFRIEPPGLFRGRGEHPKTGRVKTRVMPEQVTINIGKEATVPEPPAGHKWGSVIHDNTVTWLATWKENVNGNIKYVMLAATSSLKGMSDYKKFEKARDLKKHIDHIRKDYTKELKDKETAKRQRATAMYLIDKLALRAGNEKGEDEADTVGCCSLRYEHITLEPPNIVVFDFLGKDSIRYYDRVEVDPQVFKNLIIFKKAPKTIGYMIFDRLSTPLLNKHLQNYMPGLTAKVFRTYNASWTMCQELKKFKNVGSVHDKILQYNAANRKVAILCNHQRTVSKGHDASIEKIEDKIKGMQYKKYRIKKMMLELEPKLKKKKDFMEADPDMTEEWILEHQARLVELEEEKIRKKFAKDNEKLIADGEKPMPDKELNERLKKAKEMADEFKRENKSKKIEPDGRNSTIEKCEANLRKLDDQIEQTRIQMQDKEDNKTVALGTSKINYIDPRLTVMFCKKFDVPIEKLFAKTLREKFKWALESADENWEF